MGISIGSLLVALSVSLGQTTTGIEEEERDFQGKVFQQWWGKEFVWEFDQLPTEGKVSEERVPYSGHIYPDTAGGTMATLRKYDQAFNGGRLVATAHERRDTSQGEVVRRPVTYSQRVGLFGIRTFTQIETSYATPGWYGHCNGWTSAAIRHAEPSRSVTRGGVEFTPADIKALLAEIYMYNDPQMLAGDDTDINAGVFHAVLTNWLGRGSHPIGMEADPGEEKWNYPIHAFEMQSSRWSPQQVEVGMTITYAMSTQGEYQQSPRIPYAKYFHYLLSLDDDGQIVGGRYFRDSSSIDMLWVPLRPKKGGSEGNERGNPHVDVDEVLAIWRQSVTDEVRRSWAIIDPPNRTPVITSRLASSVAENQLVAITVTAADGDLQDQLAFVGLQTLTFSLQGGADQACFSIDSESGELRFTQAPNYEKPADDDEDNVYEVAVQVDDGAGGTSSQLLKIGVTDANDGPVISSRHGEAAENQLAAIAITYTDEDQTAEALRCEITGGDDRARFVIDRETGALSFKDLPDYEMPADHDENNVYDVEVTVTDYAGATDTELVRVTVTNANDTPRITSAHVVRASEDRLAVLTVERQDEDLPRQALLCSLIGGEDRECFAIDSKTGKLAFRSAADFEKPGDADGDNIYQVEIAVTDGAGGRASQLVSVVLTDANDNPVITSTGAEVAENQLAVLMLEHSDQDLPKQPLTCSLRGGADREQFVIDAATGKLTFKVAPDFEQPVDADQDNVYEVEVAVQDFARGTATQLLRVSVINDNDAPYIVSDDRVQVAENQLAALAVQPADQDLPEDTLQCSIAGGADRAMFAIDSQTGELTFRQAPDFEKPADADRDNIYQVEVKISDAAGAAAKQLLHVSVGNANDPPVITSSGASQLAENQLAVLTVASRDADLPAQTLRCSLSGGADRNRFAIDARSGRLSFKQAPDFEKPSDADSNNVYEVAVKVEDGAGGSAVQSFRVAVTNANDPPVITSSSAAQATENQTGPISVKADDPDLPSQSLAFSLSGGADRGQFAIDSETGDLRFLTAPDFEHPADANADNTYEVEVQVEDEANGQAAQQLRIAVVDANDRPVIAYSPRVPENRIEILTLDVYDEDRAPQMLRMSLGGGADRKLFAIDSKTGDLSFKTAPDFEKPGDANGDNIYEVEGLLSQERPPGHEIRRARGPRQCAIRLGP